MRVRSTIAEELERIGEVLEIREGGAEGAGSTGEKGLESAGEKSEPGNKTEEGESSETERWNRTGEDKMENRRVDAGVTCGTSWGPR